MAPSYVMTGGALQPDRTDSFLIHTCAVPSGDPNNYTPDTHTHTVSGTSTAHFAIQNSD